MLTVRYVGRCAVNVDTAAERVVDDAWAVVDERGDGYGAWATEAEARADADRVNAALAEAE